MDNGKLKIFGITVLCTALSLIFTLCAGLLTTLSLIFSTVVSVSVAYLYIRCGGVLAVVSVAVTAAAMLALSGGNAEILIIAALGAAPGLVSGFLHRRGSSHYTALCGICISYGLVAASLIVYLGTMIEGGIGAVFDAAIKAQSKMNIVPAGMDETFSEVFAAMIEYVRMMFPSLIIIFSMILGYIHTVAVKMLSDKASGIRLDYVPFAQNKAPRHMSYIYFIASIVIIFSKGGTQLYGVLANVVAVLDIMLAFCGLSFIEFKLRMKIKYGALRALIYIAAIMLLNNFAFTILSFVGMLDSFADFRGIKRIGE